MNRENDGGTSHDDVFSMRDPTDTSTTITIRPAETVHQTSYTAEKVRRTRPWNKRDNQKHIGKL